MKLEQMGESLDTLKKDNVVVKKIKKIGDNILDSS